MVYSTFETENVKDESGTYYAKTKEIYQRLMCTMSKIYNNQYDESGFYSMVSLIKLGITNSRTIGVMCYPVHSTTYE